MQLHEQRQLAGNPSPGPGPHARTCRPPLVGPELGQLGGRKPHREGNHRKAARRGEAAGRAG